MDSILTRQSLLSSSSINRTKICNLYHSQSKPLTFSTATENSYDIFKSSRISLGSLPTIQNSLLHLSLSPSRNLSQKESSFGVINALPEGTVEPTNVAEVESPSLPSDPLPSPLPPSTPPPPLKNISDIHFVKITQDTFSLRCCCSERLKFEVEYGLKRGTTENSYIIKGQSGSVLIDVPDQSFAEPFAQKLSEVIDILDLKWIILGHLSPKRTESLLAIAKSRPENSPRIKLFCSNPAAKTLSITFSEDIINQHFEVFIVKSGDNNAFNIGNGREVEMILAPTPRWPDSLLTYDSTTQLLFTQKLFSAHICEANDFDIGGWDLYGEHWKYFFDCMLAPVAKQLNVVLERVPIVAQFSTPSYSGKTGIDVVKADFGYIWSSVMRVLNLDISVTSSFYRTNRSDGDFVVSAICPLHGPIIKSTLTELVREYKHWTEEKLKQAQDMKVAVIFASAYGNTSALAQAISRGILKAGVGIETMNCEMISGNEVMEVVQKCDGFVVGSPTLGGHMPTPVQEALGAILTDPTARGKPCGVFGSFGWSGEAVDEMEQRLKDGGFSFAFPAIRCKFKPTEKMLQLCEESGTDIAQKIKKLKIREKANEASSPSSISSNVEQAVGRVVGSLCVVSAKSGDAESAMLASWISQASFNPPGLTVAVSKDRAIESLVLPGGKFGVSVLGGEKVSPVMKQLLRPFQPGEPRFGNLDVFSAPNGATILKDAISYLECTVEGRMETGDHWVIYASVDGGDLLDDKTLTAVHHRKSGSRY